MKPDDVVCFCFHVTLRKVETFCRVEKPKVASQISECLSAGTGCGWCVPLLKKIHGRCCPGEVPWWRQGGEEGVRVEGSEEERAMGREEYLRRKGEGAGGKEGNRAIGQ